jgi:hypothetical protein
MSQELEALKKENQELKNGLNECFRKLDEGTLHVIYCNGNHNKRVGTEGMICNCSLGKEIRYLRGSLREVIKEAESYMGIGWDTGEESKQLQASIKEANRIINLKY